MDLSHRFCTALLWIALGGVWLAACNGGPGRATDPPLTATLEPGTTPVTLTPTASPVPPTATPTPVPPVALVNGEPITLAEYNAHLQLLEMALAETGTELAPEEKNERILKDLIDQLLLAQAASEAGFVADQETVEERIEALADQVGGSSGLEAWQQAHAYTPESFRQDLARAIAAAWMRDQIVASVPEAAEQVNARQILLYNSGDAAAVLSRIEAGESFEVLARVNDPQGFGELGWFPRGYLMEPEIEEAAFAMQPGDVSGVIETELGFHILKVVDRSESRPLSPQARFDLQLQALRDWLEERRAASEIEILSP